MDFYNRTVLSVTLKSYKMSCKEVISLMESAFVLRWITEEERDDLIKLVNVVYGEEEEDGLQQEDLD